MPKKQNLPEKKTRHVAEASENLNPKIEVDEFGKLRIKLSSHELGFGTDDDDLILTTVNQLALVLSRGKEINSQSDQMVLNGVFAAIAESKPKDSIELMLATQMATIHNTAMELLRRAMLSEQTFEGIDGNINRANKLMRTFTAQVEALNKYRTKGQQKITVQHVNVNDGGQAIVGDVKGVGNG